MSAPVSTPMSTPMSTPVPVLATASGSPPALSYDDLSPGSDIQRVYEGDSLRITLPASEPPPAVMKQAAFDALASGASSSWALLLLSFVIFYFGIRANRVSGTSLLWAWTFFAIFCGALMMLIAWIRYGMLLDALRAGRRQMTVLAATPARLLIETTGPFATASYDLPRASLQRIRHERGVMQDSAGRFFRVPHLLLELHDQRTIRLLPARDPRELKFVAAALQRALDLPPR